MKAPRSLLPPLSPLGGGAPPSRSPLPSSSAHHQPRNRKVPHSLPEVVLVVARARRWAGSRRPGRRQPPGSRTAAPRAPVARARALHLLAPCTLTHTQEGLPGVVPHERVHPRGTARSPSPLSPPRRAESSSPGRRRRAPRQPAGQHVCTRTMRTGHDPVHPAAQNRQAKARLAKHYAPPEDSEKRALECEVRRGVAHRGAPSSPTSRSIEASSHALERFQILPRSGKV